MKVGTLPRIGVCAVMLLLVASYTPRLGALPGVEIDRYFYTGCTTLTEVGEWYIGCFGGISTYGTLDGDWKEQYSWDCDTGAQTYQVWEKCNGSWRVADFLGDCRCDHP